MANPIKDILDQAGPVAVPDNTIADDVLARGKDQPPAPPPPVGHDNPPDKPPDKPGGTTTTTTGGGSSAAPADPDAALISQATSLYTQLWGQPPPSNYVDKLIHGGMNIWEFEDNERHKPAFRKTKTFRDEGATWADMLHNLGVA